LIQKLASANKYINNLNIIIEKYNICNWTCNIDLTRAHILHPWRVYYNT